MLTATRKGTMRTHTATGSVRAVKDALHRMEMGSDPRGMDMQLPVHLAVLAERVRRLNQRGGAFAGVRLSPCVERLRAASPALRVTD
jgi:hypothetical protein